VETMVFTTRKCSNALVEPTTLFWEEFTDMSVRTAPQVSTVIKKVRPITLPMLAHLDISVLINP
jgi:hypothetical protein